MNEIKKPLFRSKIRRRLGKQYYIFKRKFEWLFGNYKFSKKDETVLTEYLVFSHKSFVMRPLKDVEMYLQENKRVNLLIALDKLDGLLIKPGETFSFWYNVGKTTKKKGYLEGLVLNQGKIDKDIGGGLCQMGNLLFWIFAHSPLTITERHRHGFDVFPDLNRKIPFGAGATLAYNYIDLQVKNETSNSFRVKLWIDDDYLYGQLYAKNQLNKTFDVQEENHLINQQYWGGYSRHNQIWQHVTDDKGNKSKKLLVENHALMMYNPFLENKPTN